MLKFLAPRDRVHLSMNESDPVLYELHYTLKAGTPEDAAAKAGAVIGLIEKEHGIVVSQIPPAQKALAYPIRKEHETYIGWIHFMVKPDITPKLEAHLRAEPSLLRSLLTRTQKEDRASEPRRRKHVVVNAPAPETQAKNEVIDKKLEEILGA